MKIKIFLLALFINTLIFFALPFIKYIQDKKFNNLLAQNSKRSLVRTIKITPPKKKIKKIKIKKKQVPEENQIKNDRFKLNLSLTSDSGVGINSQKAINIIYEEGEVDSLPAKISGRDPEVPNLFASASLKGRVEALVIINEEGEIIKIEITKEEPRGYQLKNVVSSALWGWKFKPATLKNIPVKIQVIIPFIF